MKAFNVTVASNADGVELERIIRRLGFTADSPEASRVRECARRVVLSLSVDENGNCAVIGVDGKEVR